jgi:hypothetical protein
MDAFSRRAGREGALWFALLSSCSSRTCCCRPERPDKAPQKRPSELLALAHTGHQAMSAARRARACARTITRECFLTQHKYINTRTRTHARTHALTPSHTHSHTHTHTHTHTRIASGDIASGDMKCSPPLDAEPRQAGAQKLSERPRL